MTFYRWYARVQAGGPEALKDKPSRPTRVWNRIPEEILFNSLLAHRGNYQLQPGQELG